MTTIQSTTLSQLVEDFSKNEYSFLKASYNEEQTREEWINPLFELLGWDVTNRSKFAQNYGLTTSKTINLIYDSEDSLVVTDAMFVFGVKENVNPKVILAVMQSRPFLFFYRVSNQGESRVIPQLKAAKLMPLPFPQLRPGDSFSTKLASLVDRAMEVRDAIDEAKNDSDRKVLEIGFENILRQIDSEVCGVYGLTESDSKYIQEWLSN